MRAHTQTQRGLTIIGITLISFDIFPFFRRLPDVVTCAKIRGCLLHKEVIQPMLQAGGRLCWIILYKLTAES